MHATFIFRIYSIRMLIHIKSLLVGMFTSTISHTYTISRIHTVSRTYTISRTYTVHNSCVFELWGVSHIVLHTHTQVYITGKGCLLDGTSLDSALMAKRRRGGGAGELDAAIDFQVTHLIGAPRVLP
jgi:hypothetical protein